MTPVRIGRALACRRPAFHRLPICLTALFWVASVASVRAEVFPGPGRSVAADPLRLQHVRAALQPRGSTQAALDRLARKAPPDSISVLVVGCDFSDSLMVGRDRTAFEGWPPARRQAQRLPLSDVPMFAAHDSTYFDLQMERVADYFRTVSFGRFAMGWEVHPRIVNLPEAMGWYADPDSGDLRAVRMASQVVTAVDAEVDFSRYDTLVLIHAGAGRETDVARDSPEQIFSNYLDRRDFEEAFQAGVLTDPRLESGEGPIGHVLVLPESESQDPAPSNPFSGFFDVRGVYCFEFGLRLGMLSLADFTPSNFPDSQGIGNYGLMGYGLFTGLGIVPSAPCAINRWLMGWVDAVDVRSDADLRIGAMDAVGKAVAETLLVRVPISDREYWLVEYRLQDPDGDLFYSFDDLNGNFVPDFFDADSDSGDGRPSSTFDPSVDVWEDELGAEWDYFMSENPARSADGCQRGGGSGLYIWHIDERVIADALLSGSNTINADADHKGVDVEEADGIEDLDSARASPYLLGGDDDVFRGEGADTFGPTTRPSTTTVEGLPTGILFTSIAPVVEDSLPRVDGFCTGFVYRPALTFSLRFGAVVAGGPVEAARRSFDRLVPRGPIRLADLGRGAADPTADGIDEIVAIADSGRIYVLDGSLSGVVDDADPSSPPGVIGSEIDAGAPQGLSLFDLDDDGVVEAVAAWSGRSRVFSIDGSAAASEWSPVGVFTGAAAVSNGEILQLEAGPAGVAMHRRGPNGEDLGRGPEVSGSFAAGPVLAADTAAELLYFARVPSGAWALRTIGPSGATADALALEAVDSTATAVLIPGEDWVAFADTAGAAVRVDRAGGGRSRSLDHGVPPSGLAAAPATPGGADLILAQSSGGVLHVYDRNLREREGFPYRPRRIGETYVAAPVAPAPLLVDLDGDDRVEVVWHDPSGQLHAVDLEGRSLPGWPVAGPAEPFSAPAVGDVDGDGLLELVAAGAFDRILSIDAPNQRFDSRREGEIRVYDLQTPASAYAPWPQAGGGPAGHGRSVAAAPVVASGGLVEGSLFVAPNPVREGFVRVRVRVGRTTTVRAALYTLEGEKLLESPASETPAGSAFATDLVLGDLAPGMYLCRVEAEGTSQSAVVAVVR